VRVLLYKIWSVRKKRKGRRRLTPGMTRREYNSNEQMRSVGDEKGTLPPTITRDGSQKMGKPNLDGLLQSQIPMEAMRERWIEPRVRTGA
jgi:hypothetical protein